MKKKFWLVLAALAAVLTVFVGFSSTRTPAYAAKSSKKVLVVYFSRREGVYKGPLKVGNTERLARAIKKRTKADVYQIEPQKQYSNSYKKTADRAQREEQNGARPALKGSLPNVSKYDTVFIGAPVWWGTYPMVVRTFLDKEPGLNGKTLIPFTTNEGSGLADTSEILSKQFSKAKVRKGFSLRGTYVQKHPKKAQKKVNSWLKKLGY